MNKFKLAKELQRGDKGYKNIKGMLEHLDDMESIFIILCRDQKVAYINTEGCKVLETEYNLVVGKNWFDNFIFEFDRKNVKSIFDELMEGKLENFNTHTNAILTKKSNKINIRWDNSLIKNKVKHIVGSFSLGKEEKTSDDIHSIISICAYCKDIRNSNDEWGKIEKYFTEEHDHIFSHGICPDCLRKEITKIK